MKSSMWSPLKIPVYRAFWICAFFSNLGTWIQDVAASWVMTHLSSSPLVIALLSFATSLPVVFLGITAGYIADHGHRRRILILAQTGMFISSCILTYLVWTDSITEVSLLFFCFITGLGFALTNPAFQSVLTDLVPVQNQTLAVLVYYMGINITRVLGPTLGGSLVGSFGPSAAFLFNALSYLGLILFYWHWPVKENIVQRKMETWSKKEWGFLFSPQNMKFWFEILCVTFFASSLWALYPLRGRIELELNSWQYGSLLGFLGLGACLSAIFSERFTLPHRAKKSLGIAYVVYSLGLVLMAVARNYHLMSLAMFFAGIGWLILATLMNMNSRELTGSSHLRATMMGVFLAVFYAGMSLGSITWGVVARFGSSSIALMTSAVGLALIGFYRLKRTSLRWSP